MPLVVVALILVLVYNNGVTWSLSTAGVTGIAVAAAAVVAAAGRATTGIVAVGGAISDATGVGGDVVTGDALVVVAAPPPNTART